MTETLIGILTVLLIISTDVLCAERRLWGITDDSRYGYFDDRRRQEMLEATRHMFYFGYDSYMTHAFPKDELDPIHCTGRGPDYDNPCVIVSFYYTSRVATCLLGHIRGDSAVPERSSCCGWAGGGPVPPAVPVQPAATRPFGRRAVRKPATRPTSKSTYSA